MRIIISLTFVAFCLFAGSIPIYSQIVPKNIEVMATSPHLADDKDRSVVTIRVTDDGNQPVRDALVFVEAASPAINLRVCHFAVYLKAENLGNGFYRTSFTSPLPGPVVVTASDLKSDASGFATVQFESVPGAVSSASKDVTALANENCIAFFDDLDNATYPPILMKRVQDGTATDQDKKVLDAVNKVMRELLQCLVDLEKRIANKLDQTEEQKKKLDELKEKIKKLKMDLKTELKRLSDVQIGLFKKHFPDGAGGIDFAKVQECMELFDNFKLVKDFNDPVRKVLDGPNSPGAYRYWTKFAECMIDSDIDKEIWTKLLKTLTKGFFIVMRTGFNPPGVNRPKMLTDEEIKKLRDEIDKLTTAQQLEDKLMEAVKEAKTNKIVSSQRQIEMMPGLAMSATVQSFSANNANALPAKVTANTLPTNATDQLLYLAQNGTSLFGYGIDRGGRAYTILGTVEGSRASFTVAGLATLAGFGVASFTDCPSTLYEGKIEPGKITGTFVGSADGFREGIEGSYRWSGSFVLENVTDVNKDGMVNQTDLQIVTKHLGARQGDALYDLSVDVDRNQVINLMDLTMVGQNIGRNLGPIQ